MAVVVKIFLKNWMCGSGSVSQISLREESTSKKLRLSLPLVQCLLKEVHILGIQELVILSELHSAALCLVCVT